MLFSSPPKDHREIRVTASHRIEPLEIGCFGKAGNEISAFHRLVWPVVESDLQRGLVVPDCALERVALLRRRIGTGHEFLNELRRHERTRVGQLGDSSGI